MTNIALALGPGICRTGAHGAAQLAARVIRPDAPCMDKPPLVALHGISRGARAILAAFASRAQAQGRILVVPRFSFRHWPRFQYMTRKTRPDRALLALLEDLVVRAILPAGPAELFGFSGGAQLAHRFAMLYPQRMARLHVAAAGWYCLPDAGQPYPQGIGPEATGRDLWGGRKRAALPELLALPICVYAGAQDLTRDAALRQSPALDTAQGLTRRDRAHAFADAPRAAAHSHNICPKVLLIALPGCGHDFIQCATTGDLVRLVLD